MSGRSKLTKRKPGSSQASVAEASGAVYADLLAALGATLGPLADELSERNERRGLHLFHLVTLLRPFFEGLSQLHEAMLWLARAPDVDDDIANLLREAADQVVSGTESMLAEPDPRILDEARHLMEIEFLFREFARRPEQLEAWRDLSHHERQRQFGFVALLRREEKAQGVPAGRVLFDREEYRMHSSTEHPQPLSGLPPVLSAPDEATGLFYDAGDLLHHASRVWTAGLDLARFTIPDTAQPFLARLPPLDAVEAAKQILDENNRNLGLPE